MFSLMREAKEERSQCLVRPFVLRLEEKRGDETVERIDASQCLVRPFVLRLEEVTKNVLGFRKKVAMPCPAIRAETWSYRPLGVSS